MNTTFTTRLVGIVWLAVLCQTGVAAGQESRDVVFTTPFGAGEHPTTAQFYYNKRAIGEGRAAFARLLERIRELPEGASIVWGPNYARCGACSGSEPPCLPKHLYPDLWKKLEGIAADRHLSISSSYPEPWIIPTRKTPRVQFSPEIFADGPPDKVKFDATLVWEIGEGSEFIFDRDLPAGTEFFGGRLHRFSSNKTSLAGYDREYFLDRLPENSRLLVRVTLRAGQKANDATALADLAKVVNANLFSQVGRHVVSGKLKATVVVPAAIKPLLNQQPASEPSRLWIGWKNFHGPSTPHDEVLYFANSTFLGRGNAGFNRLLEQIDGLPPDTTVELPGYELSGRAALENLTKEERETRNAQLKNLAPFGKQRDKLNGRIAARQLKVNVNDERPGADDGTVLSWDSLGDHVQQFVDYGRIIRHDERPQRPAARLGWVRYDAHQTDYNRELESKAVYTLDDAEVGPGVAGFARAMQRVEKLPQGAVVQVRVCLRTKGPFLCPLIYEGERHFERSGFEPYFSLLEWFVDVANRRKLEIQWLPDEAESCGYCELNK